MSDLVVSTRGLTRKFGSTVAVSNLDLEIRTGQIYGFLGPNGCGKTTTMRMLTGLLTPSSGTISVLGKSMPDSAEPLKQEIGYMTQIFSYYRDLTVLENLRFAAEIYGIPRARAKTRIDELLDIYDLTENADQLSGSLSGGQRQRLALAATVLHEPKLLFLDEPTSAVDPESRRKFWEQLFDLVDQGATMIVSTHFMDEAERCHRLAILDHGVKRADGAPRDLMAQLQAVVVEIEGEGLRKVKRDLDGQRHILSTAQIGARLRVLVDRAGSVCLNSFLPAVKWIPASVTPVTGGVLLGPNGYFARARRVSRLHRLRFMQQGLDGALHSNAPTICVSCPSADRC